jgi:hypothetical protein
LDVDDGRVESEILGTVLLTIRDFRGAVSLLDRHGATGKASLGGVGRRGARGTQQRRITADELRSS